MAQIHFFRVVSTTTLMLWQALKEAKALGKPAPANPMAKRASKVSKKAKK